MQPEKKCFKCGVYKKLVEFYKHPQMKDGRLNKCIECNKKDVKENRVANIDYYKEYDRIRDQLPKRIEMKETYKKTEQGKKSMLMSSLRNREKNIIKISARTLVNNAIRSGKIIKQYICEQCGSDHKRINGHHDDYAYPLTVRWLCSKCHTAWHKENGSGLNG